MLLWLSCVTPDPWPPPVEAPGQEHDCPTTELVVWYVDADVDGFGRNAATTSCDDLSDAGYARNRDDCNDYAAHIHPDAAEVCDNGVDDNCDALVDCDDPECDCGTSWGADEDCDNGVDDDGDGNADCDDADCMAGCQELDCANQQDDDDDGFVDCEDVDCWPECTQVRLLLDGGAVAGSRTTVRRSAVYGGSWQTDSTHVVASPTGTVDLHPGGVFGSSCTWRADRLEELRQRHVEHSESYGSGESTDTHEVTLTAWVTLDGFEADCLSPSGFEPPPGFLDVSVFSTSHKWSTSSWNSGSSAAWKTTSSSFVGYATGGEAAWFWY